MNKNILWGSVGIIVVVLFVWALKMGEYESAEIIKTDTYVETTNTTSVKNNVVSKPVNTKPTETFTNILPKLGNYQCDYEEVTQSNRSSNTVYLSDGKMRAEFRSHDAKGNTVASIIVYDGLDLYSWTEGKSTGTVTRPKSISDFPSIIPKDIVTAKILGSGLYNASWNCHAWAKDPSMLVKPAYLKV